MTLTGRTLRILAGVWVLLPAAGAVSPLAAVRVQGTYYNQATVIYHQERPPVPLEKQKKPVDREEDDDDTPDHPFTYRDINNLSLRLSAEKAEAVVTPSAQSGSGFFDEELAPKNRLRLYADIGFSVVLPGTDETGQMSIMPDESFALNRLSLNLLYQNWNFQVGRFLPYWGKKTSQFFHVLDIFKPHGFFKNEAEHRGIDGLNAKVYLYSQGTTSLSVELIVEPSYYLDESSLGSNISLSLEKLELMLVEYYRFEEKFATLGLGFRYDLIFGEVALPTVMGSVTFDTAYDDELDYWADRKLRVSAGADYSIGKRWTVMAEYYYNEYGREDKDRYDFSMEMVNGNFLYGRRYGFARLAYEPISDIVIDINGVWNMSDGSYIVFPSYAHKLFANLDMTMAVYVFGPRHESHEFSTERNGYGAFSVYFKARF